MSEETPTPAAAPGMAGLLTTLASSGDNWVKILIVGGLFVNGIITKRSGEATRTDVDEVRQTALKQIRVIYKNQNKWAGYATATFQQNQVIMEKLGIPKDQWPALPPIKFKTPEEEEDQ